MIGASIWAASFGPDVEIKAWLGGNAGGMIDLMRYRGVGTAHELLAESNSGTLTFNFDPGVSTALRLRVFAATVTAEPAEVFLEVSQNGQVLEAYDGMGTPLNGGGPYSEVNLGTAVHNNFSLFDFRLRL